MPRVIATLCFAVAVTLLTLSSAFAVPTQEREALVALYNATNGPNWTNNSGWLGSVGTECNWHGVSCSNGRVTELDLSSNRLSGSLPPELGQLSQLQRLIISGFDIGDFIPSGQLSGSIPRELGQLSQLQELFLGGNQLSGSIPRELSQLSQLQSLNLSWNQLTGLIPRELGQLSQLQSLNLSWNQLSGLIPSELGQLSQLQELYFSLNQLSGLIPPELGQLSQLQELRLWNNCLAATDLALIAFLNNFDSNWQAGQRDDCIPNDPTAMAIAASYIAFFDRAPDYDGLDFWSFVAYLSDILGLTDFNELELMRDLANGFADHPSFADLYSGMNTGEFVDAIYLNVGGALPDAEGRQFWLSQIQSGALTRPEFVADFVFGLLNLTEAQLNDLLAKGDITEAEYVGALLRKNRLTHRAQVGLVFTTTLGSAANLASSTDPLDPQSLAVDPVYQAAQKIVSGVSDAVATRDAALAYLAAMVANPSIVAINTASLGDIFGTTEGTGSLRVTLTPSAAVDAGAQWRRTGTTTWRNSGSTETGISAGNYTVEFRTISGWDTPSNATVSITAGQTITLTRNYIIDAVDPEPVSTTLVISRFGSGVVSVGDTGQTCTDRRCYIEIIEHEEVRLTPIADTNWVFSHWGGCSSVEGAVCVITGGQADQAVHPVFDSMIPPVLRDNVVMIDAETITKLQSQSVDTLIFESSAAQIADLQPGDVIVSTHGNGFLHRVVSITRGGSSIFVEVIDATLQDVIGQGVYVYSEAITHDQIASMELAPGVRISPVSTKSLANQGWFELEWDTKWGVIGELRFKITPTIAWDIGWLGVNEVLMKLDFDSNGEISVALEGSIDRDWELPVLNTLRITPIVIGPVVIVPTVKFFINTKGEIETFVSASYQFSIEASGGIHYEKGVGLSGLGSSPKMVGGFNTGTSSDGFGVAEVDIFLYVASAFELYGKLGPFFETGPYFKWASEMESTECFRSQGNWGVRMRTGGKLRLFGWQLGELGFTIFDRYSRDPLFTLDSEGCPDAETIQRPPPEPPLLAAQAMSQNEIMLGFFPQGSPLSRLLTRYEIHRHPGGQIANHDFGLSRIDRYLQPGTQYCYYVIAVDWLNNDNRSQPSETECATTLPASDIEPPTPPTGVSAVATSINSVRLEWNAAHDNVGVVGYMIGTENQIIDQTDQLSYDVENLKPATEYCFSIAAFDEAGNVSNPSSQVCFVTAHLATGSLRVVIFPNDAVSAGARWRRLGAPSWRESGSTETGILPGNYTIEFETADGWTTPSDASVSVFINETTLFGSIYRQQQADTGSLQITLEPAAARDAGARWQRANTNRWFKSGETETGIPVGGQTVEFRSIQNWIAPSNATVIIRAGETKSLTRSYEPETTDPVDPIDPPPPGTGRLNDTGIDWCADGNTNFLACPVALYPGQDGDYGRDAAAWAGTLDKVGDGAAGFDYTKLDNNGNVLSPNAPSWSCVRDNHTRLIWEVKVDDPGHLRHKDHTYTWYNPDPNTNGGSAGTETGTGCNSTLTGGCNTHAFVQAVNDQGLCGASDWRMPTRSELMSIVHNGRFNPAIDSEYFPNTLYNRVYWSSSPKAGWTATVWGVDFNRGGFGHRFKTNWRYVRLVRVGR